MAIAYFHALRALDVTSLTIAHVTKNAKGDYPFGSTFWRNLPRSNFQVKADRHLDNVAMSLKHTKANNGRRLNPLGYEFAFSEDMLEVVAAQPRDYPDLAGDVPLKDRIIEALSDGVKEVPDISSLVNASQGTVRKILSRYNNKAFQKLGIQWGNRYVEEEARH